MSFKVLPEEEIFKNKYPSYKLFGFIPISYEDYVKQNTQWVRAQNLDADQEVPKVKIGPND